MNWRAFFRQTAGRSSASAGFRPAGLKFWAVNAAILAALYLLIVQPLRDAIAAGDGAMEERRMTLARYESVVAQAGAIDAYAKQVAVGNARGEFIPGENEGIVAANLQARLKAAADDAKVAVRSLQMLPSRNVEGAPLLGARLQVTGSLAAVHALARNLEGSAPLLFISDADLRSQTLFWGATSDKDPEIEAQFDVLGAAAPRQAQ
jgi:general secretion pathway protein M